MLLRARLDWGPTSLMSAKDLLLFLPRAGAENEPSPLLPGEVASRGRDEGFSREREKSLETV